jgi:hypothetical protein
LEIAVEGFAVERDNEDYAAVVIVGATSGRRPGILRSPFEVAQASRRSLR